MLEFSVFGCAGERHRAIGSLRLNMGRGRLMLTCVTDILSIDRLGAPAGLPAGYEAAGANLPREIGSVRSGMDIN